MKDKMNRMHEANRKSWDTVSPHWQAKVDADGVWKRCHVVPSLVLREEELRHLGDVAGKDVCVLGSGDNLVVFALAGMKAVVTSVDISQEQLHIAAQRARQLGLDIHFLQADVTDLHSRSDESFDIVYTGGHVAVWVSDLKRYYAEACRILRTGGIFLVNEYHPFRRIWKFDTNRLEMESRYFDRGPFKYDRSEEVPEAEEGSLPSFEFHWTVSDYVMAMLDAGCELLSIEEIGDERQDWETAPLEGLPEALLLVGIKKGASSESS